MHTARERAIGPAQVGTGQIGMDIASRLLLLTIAQSLYAHVRFCKPRQVRP